MTILTDKYCDQSELERMSRLFFPDERITVAEDIPQPDELHAQVWLQEDGERLARARLIFGQFDREHSIPVGSLPQDKTELRLAECLYELLCQLTGYQPPWGMLTGVRPVKLMRMKLEEGGEELARRTIMGDYRCSESKYALAREVMDNEEAILSRSRPDSFSLYISIPFCPTRCSYCSFVSQSVEKAQKLLPDYVEYLVKELEATAQLAGELGLRLETVYMGGGTPTTLSAEQLSRVLGTVGRSFDMSAVSEFTVEAGRPDTITPEKLLAIKQSGAERISINPQTLNDEVLRGIGRRHTARQVYEAMDMARAAGFESINMDLIAGLTGDSVESFDRTLDGVLSMDPENITVHTLSMKRAATMVTSGDIRPDAFVNPAGEMLERCSERLPVSGYRPYYMYRQTRMLGNLENVGWSKPGHDGLYNVYIMDETHTIIACGAGGVTKMRQPGANNIQRVYNYKFPYEYISRFDVILDRKNEVRRFYEEFC